MQPRSLNPASRRTFLRVAAGAGAVACAPAATPAPAGSGAPGAAPAQRPAWEGEWERLAAAAKQEGKLSVLTLTGTGYRKSIGDFEAKFGVQAEHQQESSASIWAPKLQAERRAGVFSFDVVVVPPNSALTRLKPEGVWDPIRPVLFRPDILEDKQWRAGSFDGQFMDNEKQLAFSWEYTVNHYLTVDSNQVRPEEIRGYRDLLDPKWKGRIMATDYRVGSTYLAMTALRDNVPDADEFARKLFVEQQPVFTREARQRSEAIVRGRYPIVLGGSPADLKEFRDQGLAGNVRYIDVPEWDTVFGYTVFLYNRAPHPNAAKLFINWMLSKEGLAAWCKNINFNSARVDDEINDKDGAATSGRRYYQTGKESTYDKQVEAQKFLEKLLAAG